LVGVDHHGHAVHGGALDTHTTWDDTHTIRDSHRKVGIDESFVQSMVGGSYDFRNLSKVIAGDQDTTLNKFASGLTSIIGNSMRSSIKGAFNAEYGTGQKNFFKDLGNTISEAMKGAKLNVNLSHVGEEKEEGHGGGHGGGHH
jgi:hypothetical protein